jgi:hypothetical protein
MVAKRKNAFIKQIKDITVGGSLSLVLLGSSLLMQSCSEQQQETVYTKGIKTYITEIDSGVFKITDEEVVPEGQSMAYVKYLNGNTDTLTLEQAKKIAVMEADTTGKTLQEPTQNQTHYRSSGLGNVLWWGGLGYMMGRSHSMAPYSGFYASPGAYNKAQQSSSSVAASRVTRPVNSRTGFFNSSRSSGS